MSPASRLSPLTASMCCLNAMRMASYICLLLHSHIRCCPMAVWPWTALLLSGITVLSIQTLSDSPENRKQLLSTLLQNEDQLIQMLPELDNAMQELTPEAHTLGLIFILCVRSNQLLLCQCSGSKGFDMIGKKVGIKVVGLGVKWSMKEDIWNTARLDLAAS